MLIWVLGEHDYLSLREKWSSQISFQDRKSYFVNDFLKKTYNLFTNMNTYWYV